MAVQGIGSFSEPIVVSDEEDAAFVENELSRLTDSSSSSAYNSPPYDNNTPYIPKGPSLPPVPLAPATPTSPVLGQKRKWTDMRDSTQAPQTQHPADNSSGKQKKKKQRKERQAQQYERNQTSSATGGPSKQPHRSIATNVSHDMSRTFHPDDYSAMPPIMHLPYDAYQGYLPMDPYPIHAGFPFSPTDEYHPTDGPLWNVAERSTTLSPYAMPWFPPYVPPVFQPESLSYPPRLPSPPPPTTASSPDLAAAVPHRESGSETLLSSPVASLLEGPFDSNLSERLRQLEALSASLLALTNGPSSSTSTSARATGPPRPVSPPMPSHPSHPPTRSQAVGRSSFAELPAKPAVPAPETLKRMVGIPDDRCKFGHFDLAAHHLEPPPPAKVAPPIPAHTIVLAQIPKKFRNKEFVRPWAKRFGNALRISLDGRAGKALVEWGSPTAAEAAFTSMRLRGEGKEHIRAYRYIGVKNGRAKEIEEGEIEEGELVETKAKKKKKTKGKTKAQLEQRPTRAAAPAPARVPLHVTNLPLAPPPARPYAAAALTHESPPHLPPARLVNGAVAAPPDVGAIIAAATALGPVLERISHRPAAVRSMPEAGEEAMELDSDVEEEKTSPPPASTTASNVASGGEVEVEAIKVENEGEGVEEDMDVEDEDMVMSSPIGGPPVTLVPEPSPPPRLPETVSTPTPAVPAPPPPADDEVAQTARDARRRKLEEAIARTKAQLALRESALSSRPSLVSSSGSSESPSPPTPVDSPHVGGIDVAIASADGDVILVDSDPVEAADVVVKTESAAVTLDDLAISFITESIQTASASSSSSTISAILSQQRPATSSTTMLASVQLAPPTPIPRPNAIPIVAPVPTPKVAVMQPPAAPTPLTEEQKLAKQKKWFELVSGSKSLMEKIATAKNKEEKSLLMRMLKAKTKAADELKREIDLGFALATTPATTPSSTATSLSSSLSATPTPVPHSRTPSATPVPTASGTPVPTLTPGSSILQKRWPSPPTVTSMSMFRWPETAHEIIIIVSDDEAD